MLKLTLACIGVLVLTILLVFGGDMIKANNKHIYTITVTDKTVKMDSKSSHGKYLIFATLKNGKTKVFEDTDFMILGKFNSSDIYGEMQKGHTYKVDTVGFRIPFLSMYQDIMKVKEVK